MSDTTTTRKNSNEALKVLAAVVTACLALLGVFQGYAVLPHRVLSLEKESETTKAEVKSSKEILIRIEEQVRQLREELRRNR